MVKAGQLEGSLCGPGGGEYFAGDLLPMWIISTRRLCLTGKRIIEKRQEAEKECARYL